MKAQGSPLYLIAAFLSGGVLTLMIHLNAELARYSNLLFSSWGPHVTGTVAAIVSLGCLRVLRRSAQPVSVTGARPKAPLWAYLGGVSGAATVMASSYAANTPLALAGTLALGLAGQAAFSMAADQFGLFGMPQRSLDWRDYAAVALILGGSILIILFGGAL